MELNQLPRNMITKTKLFEGIEPIAKKYDYEN